MKTMVLGCGGIVGAVVLVLPMDSPTGYNRLVGLSHLLVAAENYPDLKATANFRDLQAQLEGTEHRIALARHDFNESVQRTDDVLAKRFPGQPDDQNEFPNIVVSG